MCICGPSAAGKTTLAVRLTEQLRARGRHPLLISCDDYYRCGWSPNSRYGFDTVDAIDADQLVDPSAFCLAGHWSPIALPPFSYMRTLLCAPCALPVCRAAPHTQKY